MNLSVYIIGNFKNGYNQYPNDYSTSIFNKMLSLTEAPTQIAIHRNGDLMYYSYIRKLEDDHTLGLCAVINGLQLIEIEQLFSIFEHMFTRLVSQGQLIHFNKQGAIVTSVEQLYLSLEDIKEITEALTAQIQKIKTSKLPPETYGLANDTIRKFQFSDSQDAICSQAALSGYTMVYKDSQFNTDKLNNYQSVLKSISNENATLHKNNEQLQLQLKEANERKNNKESSNAAKGWALLFGIILIVVSIVSFTQCSRNRDLEYNNSSLIEEINDLNDKCSSLENDNKSLQQEISELQQSQPLKISDLEVGVTDNNDNVIVDYGETIYSSDTKYLCPRIKIYSYTGKNVTFYIKLYRNGSLSTGSSSPAGYSYSTEVYLSSGYNTKTLGGWGNNNYGNWSSGNYRFEIWCDGMCLKSHSFTIYD